LKNLFKYGFSAFVKMNELAAGVSIYLTRWTGKSRIPIHPKHLVENPEHRWYLDFINTNYTIADLGCANGAQTIEMARKGAAVVGFEINRTSLKQATKLKSASNSDNVWFVKLDLENNNLPISDKWADVVLLLDVIEHLSQRCKILNEAYRILKNDGKLLLSAPNIQTSFKKLKTKAGLFPYADPSHVIEYTMETLNDEITRAGFRMIDSRPVVIDTLFYGLIDLVGGFSLSLYKSLISWKISQAQKNPGDTTGWRIICEKI